MVKYIIVFLLIFDISCGLDDTNKILKQNDEAIAKLQQQIKENQKKLDELQKLLDK